MERNPCKKISRRYCSVPQCSSRATSNVSLHYFPKNKQLCKEWLIKLRINKPASKYMNVCSLHFKETDYFYPGVGTFKRYLKKGSIPSERLPQRSSDKKLSDLQQTAQNQRAKRAERRVKHIEATTIATEDVNMAVEAVEEITTISSEVINEIVLEAPQISTIRINTEDKGIQVTPTIINEHRRVTLCDMIRTDRDFNAFTGIPTLNLLEKICEAANMLEQNYTKSLLLSLHQRVVLVFAKLKTDRTFLCLSPLVGVSANSCKNYFETTLEVLSIVMKSTIPWLGKEAIKNRIPASFTKFDDTRIVLDCTEVALQKNKCLRCRVMTYSHYKGDHTLKILIGIAPSGLITFLSPAYGGRISDKEIFLQSGLLDKLTPNEDAIMVDKGFLIENECIEKKIKLIRSPFLGKQKQLIAEEAAYTAEIASARVNVERTIQRLKIFKILKGRINVYLVPYMDSVFKIISGIVNLSAPLLSDERY